MPVNLAVVGAGYWGPNLIRNFSSLPGCQLLTVCDLDAARLSVVREKYPGVSTTLHLEDVITDDNLQAVAIATQAESHRKIAEACLKAGKHVFVEKPLAANSQDAKQLAVLAEERERILMVGHIFRFDSAITELIQRVKLGDIGQIRYAHTIRTSMAGTARLDTNIVWDALVHDAYILPAIFERPPRQAMSVGGCYLMEGIEDVAFVTFDFGDGALAHIYVSWYALEKVRRMTVIGSKSILEYDDLAPAKLTRFDRSYQQSDDLDAQGRAHWHWNDKGYKAIDVPKVEPLRAECQHFLDCIQNNIQPMTDGNAGLETVYILEACQKSLEMNSVWVEVKR